MRNERAKRIEVHVDGYTRVCLTVIAVLLTVLVVGLWADHVPGASRADAAKAKPWFDTSAQRDTMVQGQRTTNQKLTELVALLRDGQAKVQVVDAPKAAKRAPTRPKKK